tara:strand:- start:4097 stop:4441 length:345 start_codon:yes stop_codon:yes gene_type:complete
MMTSNKTKFMTNRDWEAMNSLDEAFSKINYLSFLIDQLQEAVDKNSMSEVTDIAAALTSFCSIYERNWDNKFTSAWNKIIRNDPNSTHDTSSVDENTTDRDWEDFWNSFYEECH